MKTRLCAVVAVAVLASVACSPTAPGSVPVPLVRLNLGPGGNSSTGFDEPAQLVIRDQAAWIDAWDKIYERVQPKPQLLEVDFTRDMILLVAMGGRGTGGYAIRLDSARAEDGDILVEGRAISPGPTCGVSLGTTQPIDIARVPWSPDTVRFDIREEESSCG